MNSLSISSYLHSSYQPRMTCLANCDCKPIESSRQRKCNQSIPWAFPVHPDAVIRQKWAHWQRGKKIRAYRKHNYDDVVVPLFQRSIFPHSLHFTIFISDILPYISISHKKYAVHPLFFSSTDTRIRQWLMLHIPCKDHGGSKPCENRKKVDENGIGGSALEISHSEANDIKVIIMNDKICIWIGA